MTEPNSLLTLVLKLNYSKPSLIRSQLIRMSGNPDRNMEYEILCSQLSTYIKRQGFQKQAGLEQEEL
jgi:hypothetical protein